MRLGREGDAESVPALVAALATESDDGVRASLVLALGAIGGETASEFLDSLSPEGARETEALSAARVRLSSPSVKVEWLPRVALPNVVFEVPEDLENSAVRMFAKAGVATIEPLQPGLLRSTVAVQASAIMPLPRWTYRIRLLLGEAEGALDDEIALHKLIAQAAIERPWLNWLSAPTETALPYRFSIEGRNPTKETFKGLLSDVRSAFEPAGLIDRPSAYCIEFVLSVVGDRTRLYLKPSFMPDHRFDYRIRDVGASINPVVAATLVRLIPMRTRGAIIDPTCGSGTLLIERGMIDDDCQLVGIDVSPTACAAARENTNAANLSDRASIVCGDALDPANWRSCGLVLANLPFGNRVAQGATQLRELYVGIINRAAEHLSADGRVLLYSANRGILEQSIASSNAFRTLARYRVQSGGLHVHIAVLGRASDTMRPVKPSHSPKRRRR